VWLVVRLHGLAKRIKLLNKIVSESLCFRYFLAILHEDNNETLIIRIILLQKARGKPKLIATVLMLVGLIAVTYYSVGDLRKNVNLFGLILLD
jgi:hypothetical protein